jgi:hypothetical protein
MSRNNPFQIDLGQIVVFDLGPSTWDLRLFPEYLTFFQIQI